LEKGSLPVKVRFDRGPHWRAQIGYILIVRDDLIEGDMFHLSPPGVGIHFTRIHGVDDCTVETLMAMEKELMEAASRFVCEDGLDVVCFACTSASALIGEERVMAELSRGAPNARTTSLITGVIRALRMLSAQRIVVATPYLDEINILEEKYLQEQGFEVLDMQGMNIVSGAEMYTVTPEFILEYARSIDRSEADAIFISCGGLRSLEIIDALEQEVGKPVVASNQAMFWDTIRLAGIDDKIEGYGQLLQLH
jgi:maleate isomerase